MDFIEKKLASLVFQDKVFETNIHQILDIYTSALKGNSFRYSYASYSDSINSLEPVEITLLLKSLKEILENLTCPSEVLPFEFMSY